MRTALALLLAAAPVSAELAGRAVNTGETDLARRMKAALAEDPARADALAERILRSSLGRVLSDSADEEGARAQLRAWIAENLGAAADLAVGFARDDAEGTDAFERSLYRQSERFLELSPDRHKGILGRLDGLGKAAKAVKSEEGLSDDDRRRLMKELFEGKSTVDKAAEGGAPGDGRPSGGPAVLDDGIYDRLSAANPSGYSPQVQALQSELNRSAPPGAPRLIETGRLDHATLAFPAHAVRYDLERLSAASERERAAFLAEALGERLPPERLADPATRDDLERRGSDVALPASHARRRFALDKARAALAAFEAAAEPAKRSVSRELIAALAARRREAARWVNMAALEESLGRLESVLPIVDGEVRRALAGCPVPEPERARFLAGGSRLEDGVRAVLAEGAAARLALENGRFAEAARLISKVRSAARRLPEEASVYRSTPARLAAARPLARWRLLLEDAALRWAPSSTYAKDAALRRKTAASARADFVRFSK